MKRMMATLARLRRLVRRPFAWIASSWRHEWRWALHGAVFERRHYRRLGFPLLMLGLLNFIWCAIILGLALLPGGADLIWNEAFAQNVIASLLTLPLSLAIGVFAGTLLHRHTMRFQARHQGERLGDGVRLAVFKFILFLQRDCAIPIDIHGPVSHRLVARAASAAQRSFVASSWSLTLPADFDLRLDETVDALSSCFSSAGDLRMAFPRAFDLMDGLRASLADIRAGRSQSDPRNTALIVLTCAAEFLRNRNTR
jgi:hypothetical protein